MYTDDDRAYDAYVDRHGEPDWDEEHDALHSPLNTVKMTRDGNELVELRLFGPPRLITVTYPPVKLPFSGTGYVPGVVMEIPYGLRQDGSVELLAQIARYEALGWARWGVRAE